MSSYFMCRKSKHKIRRATPLSFCGDINQAACMHINYQKGMPLKVTPLLQWHCIAIPKNTWGYQLRLI